MMTHMNIDIHTHTCIQCDCSDAVERWGGRHCLSAASDSMIPALCEEDAAVRVDLPPHLTANDANLKQWPDSRCRQTSVLPECWWWCGLEGCSWIKYNLLYKLFVLSTFVQCYYLCQAGGSVCLWRSRISEALTDLMTSDEQSIKSSSRIKIVMFSLFYHYVLLWQE